MNNFITQAQQLPRVTSSDWKADPAYPARQRELRAKRRAHRKAGNIIERSPGTYGGQMFSATRDGRTVDRWVERSGALRLQDEQFATPPPLPVPLTRKVTPKATPKAAQRHEIATESHVGELISQFKAIAFTGEGLESLTRCVLLCLSRLEQSREGQIPTIAPVDLVHPADKPRKARKARKAAPKAPKAPKAAESSCEEVPSIGWTVSPAGVRFVRATPAQRRQLREFIGGDDRSPLFVANEDLLSVYEDLKDQDWTHYGVFHANGSMNGAHAFKKQQMMENIRFAFQAAIVEALGTIETFEPYTPPRKSPKAAPAPAPAPAAPAPKAAPAPAAPAASADTMAQLAQLLAPALAGLVKAG